jgi:cobalt-precorrin-5B (C1)-methyltransferase
LVEKRTTLRTGFTTGTAAAAAAKGALLLITNGRAPEDVSIRLITGDWIRIPLLTCTRLGRGQARCSVTKDAGDDPDVTHGAEIGVTATVASHLAPETVTITGGRGVGTVTKPGLAIDVGEPAITQGPQRMIREAVSQALKSHPLPMGVEIQVWVKDGRKLAQKTLNRRLGIVGGISILGTTGVVRPLSHASYIATIDAALSVAKAAGLNQVVLTTGRRSERFSMQRFTQLPEEAFVQIGDFFKHSMQEVARQRFLEAVITVFFGKAVKMAQGAPHTHAAKARLTLTKLAHWTKQISQDARFAAKIAGANTARQALEMILPRYPAVIERVGHNLVGAAQGFAGLEVNIRGVIYDFTGQVIFDSKGQLQ